MARSTSLRTMEEIEQEIERLQKSEHVRLYQKHVRLLNKRRRYMNQLRWEERKGRELAASGLTLDNIEDKLAEMDEVAMEEMDD
jgi:hypothetical protein